MFVLLKLFSAPIYRFSQNPVSYNIIAYTGILTVVSLVGVTWLGLKKDLCVTSELESAAVSVM